MTQGKWRHHWGRCWSLTEITAADLALQELEPYLCSNYQKYDNSLCKICELTADSVHATLLTDLRTWMWIYYLLNWESYTALKEAVKEDIEGSKSNFANSGEAINLLSVEQCKQIMNHGTILFSLVQRFIVTEDEMMVLWRFSKHIGGCVQRSVLCVISTLSLSLALSLFEKIKVEQIRTHMQFFLINLNATHLF